MCGHQSQYTTFFFSVFFNKSRCSPQDLWHRCNQTHNITRTTLKMYLFIFSGSIQQTLGSRPPFQQSTAIRPTHLKPLPALNNAVSAQCLCCAKRCRRYVLINRLVRKKEGKQNKTKQKKTPKLCWFKRFWLNGQRQRIISAARSQVHTPGYC